MGEYEVDLFVIWWRKPRKHGPSQVLMCKISVDDDAEIEELLLQNHQLWRPQPDYVQDRH